MENMASNRCYTYFKITGNFIPDDLTKILGLEPEKHWEMFDLRPNGTPYGFALWEYGRCDVYDIYVENQMMNTLRPFFTKVDLLQEIQQKYDVFFTLEIVPTLYPGNTTPCLAPNKEVIRFCYETGTEMDIDLYVCGPDD